MVRQKKGREATAIARLSQGAYMLYINTQNNTHHRVPSAKQMINHEMLCGWFGVFCLFKTMYFVGFGVLYVKLCIETVWQFGELPTV